MANDIGVGLVGYGLAGRVFHGMLVRATPGLSVRAIVTSDGERRQSAQSDFPGAVVYDTFDRLLADKNVDLVVIGTPHETHASLTIEAVSRGKHVVVDKIMALSVAEADAMAGAAAHNGRLLSIFHNRRWDSDFLTVKRAVEDGLLGEVYSVESSVVRYASPPDPTRLPWRAKAERGGGPLRDWGAHLLDQAIQLFGPRIDSVAADFQYRWPGVDVETAATCDIRFSGGVRYRVEVGHISMIGKPRWYVRGSRGALVIKGLDPQETALKQGEVVAGTERARMPQDACRLVSDVPGASLPILPGDYLAYYRDVAGALNEERPPAVTAASVRPSLQVLEAAVRSVQTGQVVNDI